MKRVIFISHITEERYIALALKQLIETEFLGLAEVFVSSDPKSLAVGTRWLDVVSNALDSAAVEIIICSPDSISRPWVNFEAGCAWTRKIPVIPLCHSGISPSELPMPLSQLQGVVAGTEDGIRRMFETIAKEIGINTPKTDFSKAIVELGMNEGGIFWEDLNESFRQLLRKLSEVYEEAPDLFLLNLFEDEYFENEAGRVFFSISLEPEELDQVCIAAKFLLAQDVLRIGLYDKENVEPPFEHPILADLGPADASRTSMPPLYGITLTRSFTRLIAHPKFSLKKRYEENKKEIKNRLDESRKRSHELEKELRVQLELTRSSSADKSSGIV